MKLLRSIFIYVVISVAFAKFANAGDNGQIVIYINSEKFSSLLIEKWITEYAVINPNIQIKWADKNNEDVDLSFVTNEKTDIDTESGKEITYVGRYALLPVTTKENPVYGLIAKKRWNKKELKKLFFIEDDFDGEESKKEIAFREKVTIYSSNNSTSGTALFSTYFGYSPNNLRGKRIAGDDIYLLNAIRKDNTGITFNNLSYIYDLNGRRLKDKIAILPLDIKKDQFEAINSENLDKTLTLLENEKVELIPVQSIGFVYDKEDKENTKDFLKWVITDGQKYNHEYGFLSLDEKTLNNQKQQLEYKLLTTN
jgi:hypothetical protein